MTIRSASGSDFPSLGHVSKPAEIHEKTLLTPVGFGCGQKLAAEPHCTQAMLNNCSAWLIAIAAVFIVPGAG